MPGPDFSLTWGAPAAGRYASERGFGLYHAMRDIAGRADFNWETWGDVGWGVGGLDPVPNNLAYLPSAFYISEIETIIPRPFWRFDAIGSEWWNVYPALVGVEELPSAGQLGDCVRMHFYRSDLAELTGAWSVFSLPPNPNFMVEITRFPLPVDWSWAAAEPRTDVVFGQYVLEIPWERPARLRYRSDWLTVLDEFNLRGDRLGGAERIELTVMCLKGSVLFSTDRGQSWHVYTPEPDPYEWELVQGATMGIHNYGGRWMFAVAPLDCPGDGRFVSAAVAIGYEPTAEQSGAARSTGSGEHDTHDGFTLGGYQGSIEVERDLTAPDDYMRYRATLEADRYPRAGTYFAVFPQLYAVRLMVPPVCDTRAGGDADAVPATDVQSLEIRFRVEDEAVIGGASLTLKSSAAKNYDELQEYAPVTITLQGKDEDEAADVFFGYVHRLSPEQQGTLETVRVELASPWLKLGDQKVYPHDPCFADWYTEEVVEWIADRCGLPEAYEKDADYEDDGRRLPVGFWGDRQFQFEPGREWAEALREVARYEKYQVWFEAATLHYAALPDDDQGVDWHVYHSTADYNASGESAKLKAMRPSAECPRDPDDHRNEVAVVGRDRATGDYLAAKATDSTNIEEQVGWPKTLLVVDPAYDTQARVQLVCRKAYDALRKFPPRRIRIEVEGTAAVQCRQAFQWHGDGLYADDQVFRIEAVTHRFERSVNQYRTLIEGVWIRDES